MGRHWDFIILDLITFITAYYLAIQARRVIDISIRHDELFIRYGLVALGIFLGVDIVMRNLDGVMLRSIPKEFVSVGQQMAITWAFYTVVLFLLMEGHYYSRFVYLLAFITCFTGILIARILWRSVIKYGKLHATLLPKLVVVCDANRAQRVIERVLLGYYERRYEITGIIVNERSKINYGDHYPIVIGLGNLVSLIEDDRVHDAYVELDDVDEESVVIEELLQAGVSVHRSLGDSKLEYAIQYIDEFSSHTVITIEGPQISWVNKASRLWGTITAKQQQRKL